MPGRAYAPDDLHFPAVQRHRSAWVSSNATVGGPGLRNLAPDSPRHSDNVQGLCTRSPRVHSAIRRRSTSQSAPSAILRRAAQADPAIRARTASQRTEPPGGHGRPWPSPPRTDRDEAAARSAYAPSASRCRDHSLVQSVIRSKPVSAPRDGHRPVRGHLPRTCPGIKQPAGNQTAPIARAPISVRRRWLRLQHVIAGLKTAAGLAIPPPAPPSTAPSSTAGASAYARRRPVMAWRTPPGAHLFFLFTTFPRRRKILNQLPNTLSGGR